MQKFSVLIPVYIGDKAEYLIEAINSVINQTITPEEIVVVLDGPVSDAVKNILKNPKLTVHNFEKNRGLGSVLADGITLCKNELIARMDADDISLPDRFEKQLSFLSTHPDIDVLGGMIDEFSEIQNTMRTRKVPLSFHEIKKFAKRRNPMNHVTVMFKKSCVLGAGNYQQMHYFEDYYLWMRMISKGYTLRNINQTLVNVRIEGFDDRRGGKSYIKQEINFYNTLLKEKHIGFFTFFITLSSRIIIRVFGTKIVNFVYNKVLRQN